MTPSRARLDRHRRLIADADLADQLGCLLERALNPRQLWLLFLGADDRLSDLIMPCDDYPDDPAEALDGDGDGAGFADLLADRLVEIVEMTDTSRVVLVWERQGPCTFGRDELRWARAMSTACAHAGVSLRAQFLLHDGGVRILTPDDYARG